MALRSPLGSKSGILFVSWNQNGTCVALGTQQGIKIYSRHTHSICYEHLPGAIGCGHGAWAASIAMYLQSAVQP